MEKWESRGEVDEIIEGIGEETGRDQRRSEKGGREREEKKRMVG